MDVSAHMGARPIPELNLSAQCHPNTNIVDKINAMPALKTSTAFFTFLRANLVLPHSAMSSNVSTPYLSPHTSQTLPLPSPSPLATNPPLTTLDDDIPPLSLDILTTPADKASALALITDSIAQQRQQAASSLTTHPLPLTLLLASLFLTYRYITPPSDLGTTLLLFCSLITTYLLTIRYLTSPYLTLASSFSPSWLLDPHSQTEDLIIATRFGTEIIGALVLHVEPNIVFGTGKRGSGKKGSISMKGGKGVVRAWTTKLRYRGKGVGEDMLREAVRVTRERCGRDAEVGFAREHANSARVLPEGWGFNRGMWKGEFRAARALERVERGERRR